MDEKGDIKGKIERITGVADTHGDDNSFAWELIINARNDAKRWFVVAMTALFLWFTTVGIFVGVVCWTLNNFEMLSYEISTDGGGDANYIGNDGDILNGKDKSQKD